jgi:uncharacterized protein YkwD
MPARVGGLLIDILVFGIVACFAWAGSTLGLVRASVRLIAAAGAVLLAVLLRAPVATLFERITPASPEFSSLLAVLVVGVGSYLALAALATYYSAWVRHDELAHLDRGLGAIPGGLLGVGWCGLMLGFVVLLPTEAAVTRATIESNTGGVMIKHVPSVLKWMRTSFPRYTQTLPKGRLGAETRPIQEDLPVLVTEEPRDQREEAGTLLSNINAYRKSKGLDTLAWNLEVASAARRHSKAMFEDSFFDYAPPAGGLPFEGRMKSSLGTNVPRYDRFAEQVVWAHGVANAFAAIVRDREARELLLDRNLTEIGIGVSDGGWFNGYMFTIGYLGRAGNVPGETPGVPAEDPAAGASEADVLGEFGDPGATASPPAAGTTPAPLDQGTGVTPTPPPGEAAPPGASGIVTD